MKLLSSSALAVSLLALAACAAAPSEVTGEDVQEQITDTVSITQRPDGSFTVVCRGRNGQPDFVQTVTALQIQDNSVCSPPAPPGPSVVVGGDRSFPLGASLSNAEVDAFGRGLWSGYVSFTAVISGGNLGPDSATIVDGTGAKYPVPTTATRFERLPLPVRVLATTDPYYAPTVGLQKIALEATSTPPLSLSGKYAGADRTLVRTLGADVPGVKLSFNAEAKLFENFTNGNTCSRVILVDAANQTVTLEPTAPTRRVSMKTPISAFAQSTCISSRLPTPQNAASDFTLEVTSAAFGALN